MSEPTPTEPVRDGAASGSREGPVSEPEPPSSRESEPTSARGSAPPSARGSAPPLSRRELLDGRTMTARMRALRDPPRHPLVLPLAGLYAATLFAWCFLRHKNFGSSAFELGAYHSLIWNLAYRGTPWNSLAFAHQWSTHLDLGVLVLVPFYRIVPSPAWLWLAEGLACGAVALPIDALARRITGDAVVGLFAAAAMLLTPQLVLGQVADFQPIALAILPIAVMAWSIEADSSRGLVLGSLGAMLLREQLGVVVAIAAGLWVLRQGVRRAPPAVVLAVFALAMTWIQLRVIIPSFGDEQAAHYAAQYGAGVGDMANIAASRPGALIRSVFETRRLLYVAGLVSGALPLVLLSFRSLRQSAWPLALGASPLAVQLLSSEPRKWDLQYPYGVPVVAALAAAAVLALRWLPAKEGKPDMRRLGAAGWLTLVFLHLAVVAPSPFGRGRALDRAFAGSPRAAALARALSLVPADASVSAQDHVVPHVAARSEVHRWPDGESTDDYVLIDLDGPAANVRNPGTLVGAARRLRADPGFEVLVDQAGVMLAKRRSP